MGVKGKINKGYHRMVGRKSKSQVEHDDCIIQMLYKF